MNNDPLIDLAFKVGALLSASIISALWAFTASQVWLAFGLLAGGMALCAAMINAHHTDKPPQ